MASFVNDDPQPLFILAGESYATMAQLAQVAEAANMSLDDLLAMVESTA